MKYVSENILRKKCFRVSIAVIFHIFFFSTVIAAPPELGKIFQELGISMAGIDGFIIKKDVLTDSSDTPSRLVISEHKGSVLRLEVISGIGREDADMLMEDNLYMVKSLFAPAPSPYPGMISNTIGMPDELSPKVKTLKIDDRSFELLLLPAGSRFTYGVTAEDLVAYRAAMTYVYLQDRKTLYRIELFVPKKDYSQSSVVGLLGTFSRSSDTLPKTAEEASRKAFNLIIIGIEPLGARHVGVYGYSKDVTPNIDVFAENSYVFTSAVSPSSWTLPVFMSWFTSLYPSQHGLTNRYSRYSEAEHVISNTHRFRPGTLTLAQILKREGYATAAFTGDASLNSEFGYGSGFDVYYDSVAFAGLDTAVPHALEWIDEHKEGRFFVFIQGYDVHGQYRTGDEESRAEDYWRLRDRSLREEYLNVSREEKDFWRRWYDDKIRSADARFGEFMKGFAKTGLSEKTIIVVSSGSGNEIFEHGKIDHGFSLYDELIRVPLIIKIPSTRGAVIDAQVRTLDMMPTLLDVMDIAPAYTVLKQMQGVSLKPMFYGESMMLDAYSETDYLFNTFKRCIRSSDGWKLIYSLDTGEKELYRLSRDPRELNNLAEKEEQKLRELEQKLSRWMSEMGQDRDHHKKLLEQTFGPGPVNRR